MGKAFFKNLVGMICIACHELINCVPICLKLGKDG